MENRFSPNPCQGSPQEFLPAGEKAGEACQRAGVRGPPPEKFWTFAPKICSFGIFGLFLIEKIWHFWEFLLNIFTHFLVARSNLWQFLWTKSGPTTIKKVNLRKENCISANEKNSWNFTNKLLVSSAHLLVRSHSFVCCFLSLSVFLSLSSFLCFEHKIFQSSGMVHLRVPNHDVPSLYQ